MSIDYCYLCKYKRSDCKDAPDYIHERCTYYNKEEGRIKTEEEVKGAKKKEEKK